MTEERLKRKAEKIEKKEEVIKKTMELMIEEYRNEHLSYSKRSGTPTSTGGDTAAHRLSTTGCSDVDEVFQSDETSENNTSSQCAADSIVNGKSGSSDPDRVYRSCSSGGTRSVDRIQSESEGNEGPQLDAIMKAEGVGANRQVDGFGDTALEMDRDASVCCKCSVFDKCRRHYAEVRGKAFFFYFYENS